VGSRESQRHRESAEEVESAKEVESAEEALADLVGLVVK
jgi:hypothetical protein